MAGKPQNPRKRFERKFEKTSGCWIWKTGTNGKNGYGMFFDGARKVCAHRFSWELYRGPIPVGMEVDHLCKTRLCVNPDHMEVVTRAENIRRSDAPQAINARKTACPKGHPYEQFGYVNPTTGKRRCQPCGNQQSLDYYYSHKGKR